MDKKAIVVAIILFIGVIFRLILTSGGNFIFNIDNGRDMVDVREMVVLKKLRLIGPNTPIPGIYDGPVWYYLLALPFVLTLGNPYGSIIMQIVLWAVGGFYLLKLIGRFGTAAMLTVGFLWIASNFIILAGLYAFNPNPVMFLTPLLIYLIEKYLISQRLIYAALMWFLAGLFFNFEMNFGMFVPLIIILSIVFAKKTIFFSSLKFWIGTVFFLICLLPQIIFDFKHQFVMLNGLMAHLQRESGGFNFLSRVSDMANSFYNVFVPTLFNTKFLVLSILILVIPVLFRFFKSGKKDLSIIITLLFIFVPFVSYLFLPVAVNPWHLGAEIVGIIILTGFLLRRLWEINLLSKLISFSLSFLIIFFAARNIVNFFLFDMGRPNMDPSLFKNEIAAIDYVYQYADGKNFKVYTYLPSIYDYPYQYLIWWHGLKEYGFLPIDYAYAPNKPQYIPSKERFSGTSESAKKRPNSNLVFLIKEPDRNYTRSGWEGEFVKLETIEKQMIGPLQIDIKKEVIQ